MPSSSVTTLNALPPKLRHVAPEADSAVRLAHSPLRILDHSDAPLELDVRSLAEHLLVKVSRCLVHGLIGRLGHAAKLLCADQVLDHSLDRLNAFAHRVLDDAHLRIIQGVVDLVDVELVPHTVRRLPLRVVEDDVARRIVPFTSM